MELELWGNFSDQIVLFQEDAVLPNPQGGGELQVFTTGNFGPSNTKFLALNLYLNFETCNTKKLSFIAALDKKW